jgi:hypothetical protein
MGDGARVKGCLKGGCIGCGGLVVAFILVVVVIGVLAALASRTQLVEERRLDQEIPPPVGLPRPADEDIGDPLRDVEQGFRFEGVDVAAPGRVILDLSVGEFEVVPGPADAPAHVEAVFDTNRYELAQSWQAGDGGAWSYRVFFGARSFIKLIAGDDNEAPRVKIVLPRDRPFVLEGRIRMGESQVELGGLWVLDAYLKLGMGEHTVRFSEPLAAPMGALELRGSMGEVRLFDAGNASPARLEARHGMGALELDLRGSWVRDATILVRGSMGEVEVRVPDDVALELTRATVGLGEAVTRGIEDRPELPPGAPRLTLDARGSLGELRISR